VGDKSKNHKKDKATGSKWKVCGKKQWVLKQTTLSNLYNILETHQPFPPQGIRLDEDFGDSFEYDKPEGVTRLMGGNVDLFPPRNFNNSKARALREVLQRYQIDGFFGQEAGINWDLMPRSGRLEEMFRSENALRVTTGHNKHEKARRKQYGGTFAMTFGELAMRTSEMGVDETGLGHWVWMLFRGKDGHATRIISAYQPCHSRCNQDNTVYSQQLCYFCWKGESICPWAAMVRDLGQVLRKWPNEGECLILFIDANEDMTDGHMQCMLTSKGLNMRETAMSRHPNLPKTSTFMRGDRLGRVPVDGCWATDDLPEFKAGWLVVYKGVGDQFPVVEFESSVLLGENLLWVV